MMALMHTDLPLPVAPAISICGISDSSQMMGVPVISLPMATAVGEGLARMAGLSSTSLSVTMLTF